MSVLYIYIAASEFGALSGLIISEYAHVVVHYLLQSTFLLLVKLFFDKRYQKNVLVLSPFRSCVSSNIFGYHVFMACRRGL